jgi:hypothetical protein
VRFLGIVMIVGGAFFVFAAYSFLIQLVRTWGAQ